MINKLAFLSDWLDEQVCPGALWYVKRLSGNDTLANNAHQAGPYIPKKALFEVFPFEERSEEENPDFNFDLAIDSHPDFIIARAVWYNSRSRGVGTRNEARLTGFGGGSSPLLDPESTGSLAVFVFHKSGNPSEITCKVWVCDEAIEEDLIEERIGPVEPLEARIIDIDQPDLFVDRLAASSCWLPLEKLPSKWLTEFPNCADLVRHALSMKNDKAFDIDSRLLRRRKCEFELFQSLENAVELPKVRNGFETVGEFVSHAQTVLQRRRSRSGLSLELHVREILVEENFREGAGFSYQAKTEGETLADFIFPSLEAYRDGNFPADRLRMLAVKNTLKDRWSQVLGEGKRIKTKHLLTLQEGISEKQFKTLQDSGVRLVVPANLHDRYAASIRPHLLGFESFIGDLRTLQT